MASTAGAQALPRVSVVIPTYNSALTIDATLESVLGQDYPNFEVIVVDDGSADATPSVLAAYADRVRVICQPNGGLATARNAGMRAASGELIAWLDADDLCTPDRLAVQVAYLLASPDVALCASDFAAFDGHGIIAESYLAPYYATVRRAGGLGGLLGEKRTMTFPSRGAVDTYAGRAYEALAFGNFLHPPTMMFRRGLLEAVGEMNPAYRNITDYEWQLRATRAARVAVIDTPLLRYRLSPGQLSGDRNTLAQKTESLKLLDWLESTDRELAASHAPRLRARRADLHAGVAALVADSRVVDAWRHAAIAMRHGAAPARVARACVKALLPAPLMRQARRLRALEWKPVAKGLALRLPLVRPSPRPGNGGTYWNPREAAAYGYRVWLKHAAMLHAAGMEFPALVAEIGCGDSLAVGTAAVLSGVRAYDAYDVKRFADPKRDAGRVEAVASLVEARSPLPPGGWPQVERLVRTPPFAGGVPAWPHADVSRERVAAVRACLAGNGDGPIRYFAPWTPGDPVDRSYDLMLSHSVLEYVRDLDGFVAKCAEMVAPGGWMSHQVDLASLGITERWNGHLAYGRLAWWAATGARPYRPARRLASEYVAALERHGFEIAWVLRCEDPTGVRQENLAPPFRDAAREDVSCRSLYIAARRRPRPES